MPPLVFEPLRDVIGRAIYEQPADGGPAPDWYALPEARREPWRKDADRVAEAIRIHGRAQIEFLLKNHAPPRRAECEVPSEFAELFSAVPAGHIVRVELSKIERARLVSILRLLKD